MKDRLSALKSVSSIEDDDLPEYDSVAVRFDDGEFMDDFFQQVETIRSNVDKLAQNVDQVKKMHSKLLTAAVQDQEVKEDLERVMGEIKRGANTIRNSLKAMEHQINQEDQEALSNNYAESRIRRCQHSTLSRKFVSVMSDYNQTQSDYREKCKARIQRQLEITGKTKTGEEVEEMLEGGDPAIFTSDIVIETQQAKQALGDIEARHRDIINLERNIQELHEMFLDMAVLVESQGEMIDSIEHNVEQAVDFVHSARNDTKKAVKYQSRARRKKIIIIICIVVFLLIIAAVIGAEMGN